uniref:THAP-type domain-containing protein n=1 Tax=Romanomermis culicivorax TaxID=13658 RepID=A0A915HJL8_ROMCU
MASKCCTVIACTNDDRSDDVEFFPFPRGNRHFTRLMRQIWARCTGRADYWLPREDDRCFICSEHFVYGRPSLSDPFPTLRLPVKLSYVLEMVDRLDIKEMNSSAILEEGLCKNKPNIMFFAVRKFTLQKYSLADVCLRRKKPSRERIFRSHTNIPWQPKKSETAKVQSSPIIPLPSVGETFSLDHGCKFGRPKSDNAVVTVNSGKLVVAALDTIVHVDCFNSENLRQETTDEKESNPERPEKYEECNTTHAVTKLAVQQQIYSTEHTYCTCQPEPLRNTITAKTSADKYTPEEGEIEVVPHDKEQPETIEVPSEDEEICISSTKESTSLEGFKTSKAAQFKKNRNYRTSLYCNCYKNRHFSTISRVKLRRVKKMLGFVGNSTNCSICSDQFLSLRENALHICQCHLNCQVLCLRCLQYISADENSQKHKCRLKFFGFKQMHVSTETSASNVNRKKNTHVIEKSPSRQTVDNRRSDFLANHFGLHKRDSIPAISKLVNSDFSYWKRRSRHLLSSNSIVKQRQPCGRFHCPTLPCLLCNMGTKRCQTYKKKIAGQKRQKTTHVDSSQMTPTTSISEVTFSNIWDEFKSKILSECNDDNLHDNNYAFIDSKSKSLTNETVTLNL